MILITEYPRRNNAQKAGLVSRWVASSHPVIYRMQRVDYSANAATDNGLGFLKFTVVSNNPPDFEVGDTIRITSAPPFSAYSLAAEVTALAVFHTSFDVTVDAPFTVNNPLYILVNRPDYRLAVDVYEYNAAGTISKKIATTYWRPDPSGLLIVDVSQYVGKDITPKNLSPYNVLNWREENGMARFYIKWTEMFTGASGTTFGDPPDIYGMIRSAKNLGDIYGQNLGAFVPYADNDAAITNRAKFLTDFEEPTYWPGYPWDIGFVYAETIQGQDITLEEDRNTGATTAGHQDANINRTQCPGLNRLRPIFPSDSPAYEANVDSLTIWLEIGGVAVEEYVEEGYVDADYVETVPETVPGSITPYRITEEKTIRVNQKCHATPLYISWIGKVGRNYWLFDGAKTYTTPNKAGGEYQTEPLDLAAAQQREMVISRTSADVIKVGAIVDENDYKGLKTLAGSSFIQIYTPETTATNGGWLTVKLKSGSFDYDTKEDRAEIKLEFELPEFYNIVN